MNSQEAQEHLKLIDRILQDGDQRLQIGAELYLAWGIVSAIIDVVAQLVLDEKLKEAWLFLPGGLILAAIVFSIVRSMAYRRCAERLSFLQREYLNVLWLSLSLAAVASYVAHHLFSGWGGAAVWTLSAAFITFYIGLHNDRRAQIAGIVLVVSLVAANYAPQFVGYILAAGMLFGYAGFGLSSLIARD